MRFEVDAVLFDIDGTLVDSTAAVERTWRAWAARRGLDASAIIASCHGRRSEDTLATLLPEREIPAALAELEALEEADLAGVTALPGARELLSHLPAGAWAAVTSGPRPLMRARLAVSGLPIAHVLITAEDVRAGKPDPEGYLKAAAFLGREPARCLVVEDAPAGIQAGLAAGAPVLAVATSHPAACLTDATCVIGNLTGLTITGVPGALTATAA